MGETIVENVLLSINQILRVDNLEEAQTHYENMLAQVTPAYLEALFFEALIIEKQQGLESACNTYQKFLNAVAGCNLDNELLHRAKLAKSKLYLSFLRKNIKNVDFSIISNNCWGSFIYQYLGLAYNTPFIGLYLFAPDYIKMITNLKDYLQQPLFFTNKSKFEFELKRRGILDAYPIGIIGDVEIHFRHYDNKDIAKEKWVRRLERINYNNLYFEFCDRELCDKKLLEEFDALPFTHKVCFTAKEYPELKSCVWIKEDSNKSYVEYEWYKFPKYFNLVKWLNSKSQ
jgi:uncharacterized protein (DUF1919 family)